MIKEFQITGKAIEIKVDNGTIKANYMYGKTIKECKSKDGKIWFWFTKDNGMNYVRAIQSEIPVDELNDDSLYKVSLTAMLTVELDVTTRIQIKECKEIEKTFNEPNEKVNTVPKRQGKNTPVDNSDHLSLFPYDKNKLKTFKSNIIWQYDVSKITRYPIAICYHATRNLYYLLVKIIDDVYCTDIVFKDIDDLKKKYPDTFKHTSFATDTNLKLRIREELWIKMRDHVLNTTEKILEPGTGNFAHVSQRTLEEMMKRAKEKATC